MLKNKIAISIDKSLLNLLDSKIDGSIIRSRSQAIDHFLRKGLEDVSIDIAVILLKGAHQKAVLNSVKGEPMIKKQIEFLQNNGIKHIFIVTQHTPYISSIRNILADAGSDIKIIEKEVRGNAQALLSIKDFLKKDFIAMSGDIYNNFDLVKLARKHLSMDKLSTMGLMSRSEPSSYGTAILDGDFIIDFQEKPKHTTTNIVNAGIYAFKPEIFELFGDSVSLEKEIFPKIARTKQLVGFFTYGEYVHMG